MLRVRLLGELALERDGEKLAPPAGRRARALLAWLGVNPGRHPRSQVAGRFWPDVLEESARASLRGALSELRRSLGPGSDRWLAATRDRVGLGDGDDVWVDVRAAAELEAEGRLAEAVELCGRGELLAGFDDEWAYEARELHRARLDGMLERLAAEAERAGDRARAAHLSRERVALDPLSEDVGRALIRRLAAAGDRAAALDAYERLRERLATELRLTPSTETRALVSELRASAEGPSEPLEAPLAVPPPAALLGRRFRSAFAGRERELTVLSECWRRAASGERTLALLAGEPGIGKTRLAIELAGRLRPDEPVVLYGRCHEVPLVPYRPFVEALGPLAAGNPPAGDLHPLLPELRGAEPGQDGEGARFRFFQAVDRLLGRVAAARPTLLVLDDLHWADKPALLLLAHIARSPERTGLLIVGTYRHTDLDRGHPLTAALADLRRDPGFERVRLRGLDAAGARQLMAGWLPVEDVPALAPALRTETEGNPFFIEEVLADLRETGRPIDELGVPESIREAIGRRLERIGERAGRALSLAAVIGREFELGVLARAADLPTDELEQAMERALAVGLLHEEPRPAGRYAFSHALVREALYAELSLARRVRLHARIAHALEQLDPEVPERRLEEIAHHLYEAAPGGEARKAVEYAMRAAARAMTRLAYEDAAAHCTRALALLDEEGFDDPTRRCELLLALGEARLRTGEREAAREAFLAAANLARRRGDAEGLARAALGHSGLAVTIIAVDRDSVRLLQNALALDPPRALQARLLARLAIETYYGSTPERRKSVGDEAVEIARAAGDDSALVDALNARHVALWSPAYLPERLETAAEMIEVAVRVGDLERELQAHNWRVVDLAELGDMEGMRREIERHEELAERLRLPAYRWWGPMWRSTLAITEGRFAEAERLMDEFKAIGQRAGDGNAELHYEVQQAALALEQERFDELDAGMLDRQSGGPAEPAYRCGFSWLYAALGREDEAHRQIDWVAADGYARFPEDMNRLAGLCELTQACALLGYARPAPGIYERLLPYAGRNAINARAAAGYGAADHHLGVLATLMSRFEDAQRHYEDALRINAALNARPWLARTQLRHAEMLLVRGRHEDRPEAGRLLRRALATAEDVGIEALAARVRMRLGDLDQSADRAD
jgi:DNA-binding SARP family transcriptional activator/tetratricopeptide (TPR) repeat protein